MYQVPVLNNYEYQKSVINIEIDSSSIVSPKKGERYLIGKSAINDWIDKDNQIAEFYNNTWNYIPPKEGMLLYINKLNTYYIFKKNNWQEFTNDNIYKFIQITNELQLTSEDNGNFYINSNNDEEITIHLPKLNSDEQIGLSFGFINLSNNKLFIQAADNSTILDSNINGCLYTDGSISKKSIVYLLSISQNLWIIQYANGIWHTTT